MTSQLKKFVVITESDGARIETVEIPADIVGDENAELEYARENLEEFSDVLLSERDGFDAAKYILDELTTFKERHKNTLDSIKDFVRENYGSGELRNPSWDLDALAAHLVQNT